LKKTIGDLDSDLDHDDDGDDAYDDDDDEDSFDPAEDDVTEGDDDDNGGDDDDDEELLAFDDRYDDGDNENINLDDLQRMLGLQGGGRRDRDLQEGLPSVRQFHFVYEKILILKLLWC